MPGLKLTKPQAMRLFGVAPSVSAAMLRALVMENFLSRAGDGVFVRSTTDVENEPRRHASDAVVGVTALYRRADRMVACLAVNQPRALTKYRKPLAGGATWEDAMSGTAVS